MILLFSRGLKIVKAEIFLCSKQILATKCTSNIVKLKLIRQFDFARGTFLILPSATLENNAHFKSGQKRPKNIPSFTKVQS